MADGPSSSLSVSVQQHQLLTSSSLSSSRQSRRSSSMPQSNNNRQQAQQQQLTVNNANRRSSLSKIIASAAVVLVERAPIKRLVASAAALSSTATNTTNASSGAAAVLLKKQDATICASVKKDKDARMCVAGDNNNVLMSSDDNNVIVNNNAGDATMTALPVVVVTRGAAKKARQEDFIGPSQQAKKRCADRYDSSESSDSGVAVSCGDCSSSSLSSLSSGGSSGGSDIIEPGSPCSTTSSSDEGVVVVCPSPSSSSSSSSSSSLSSSINTTDKLAPTTQTQPAQEPRTHKWPWTPPLAQSLHSNCNNNNGYKRFKAEPEPGFTPRLRDDSTSRNSSSHQVKLQNKTATASVAASLPAAVQQESQGKITEYFKTQIKPQQPKTKKSQPSEVTHGLSKSSPEFRRPTPVQQRHMKNGPGKTNRNDWEVRMLTGLRFNSRYSEINKKPSITTTTTMTNNQELPVLPIPSDVLSTLPSCKISNLRFTSVACPSDSPPPSLDTTTALDDEQSDEFKNTAKTILVNENNNLTNSTNESNNSTNLFSRLILPPTPSDSTKDDDEEEEESSRDSAESKPSSLSPILSAPTTIRFPAKAPNKVRNQTLDGGFCRWVKCGVNCESTSILLEHLQTAHISSQTNGDNFVCHWQGCKVQGKASCSRRWLERHVLSHGGNKPFQCIVDGCGSRFSSQTALERHVNGHFNQSETNSTTSSRKSTENGGKLVRRNGKKLRYRRQPWSARIFDYFDPGVMEGLQHRLLELAKTRTQGRLAETPGDSMALTSQVLAKRVELDGKAKVLLRWHPEDIHPDEWVLESEVTTVKHVSIRSLAIAQPDQLNAILYPALNATSDMPLQRVKQRRKPQKNT